MKKKSFNLSNPYFVALDVTDKSAVSFETSKRTAASSIPANTFLYLRHLCVLPTVLFLRIKGEGVVRHSL